MWPLARSNSSGGEAVAGDVLELAPDDPDHLASHAPGVVPA